MGGSSRIRLSGWKALKWCGTSGPSSSITQRHIRAIISEESLCPGISNMVASNQPSVTGFR